MDDKKQHKIVVFGKGGVGKSTFASNLSMYYASKGFKILHIGCDPKSDSTLFILENVSDHHTVMEWICTDSGEHSIPRLFIKGRKGVQCIESGGPEAGVGCGGRGIARLMEYLEEWNILGRFDFDIVIFDVLGDVVCGGFAAPLRKGFGNKVVIVAAEDEMSYLAANNIARAVNRYRGNGVALAGLIVNETNKNPSLITAEKFASLLNIKILGRLPDSPAISAARRERLTAVEFTPEDPYSQEVAVIAEALLLIEPEQVPYPTPLDQPSIIGLTAFADVNSQPLETINTKLKTTVAEKVAQDSEVSSQSNNTDTQVKTVSKLIYKYSQLLGFENTSNSTPLAYLSDVTSEKNGELTLSFSTHSDDRVSILLSEKGHNLPEYKLKHFSIYLIEGAINNTIAMLLRYIGGRFGNLKLKTLVDIYNKLSRRPDAGTDGDGSSASASILQDIPASAIDNKWASFSAYDKFSRNFGGIIRYNIPYVNVSHRDIECFYATPKIRSDEFNIYNYPWGAIKQELVKNEQIAECVSIETNLDENDIIFGAMKKLSSAVNGAIDSIENKEIMILRQTCVPVVSGEDVNSVLKDARCRCPVPIYYEGPEISQSINPMLAFMMELKCKAGFKKSETSIKKINLVGYPETQGIKELKACIFAYFGIEIVSSFFPSMDLSIFDNFLSAGLSVFFPFSGLDELYDKIFGDLQIKKIRPPAPFGMKNTKDWLSTIVSSTGLQVIDNEESVTADMAQFEEQWQRLTERARSHSLGFVVDSTDLKRFSDPELTFAIPLLELLDEMGFRMQFFVYLSGKDTSPQNQFIPSLSENAKIEFKYFSTKQELDELLRSSESSCFYSDFYFDRRLAKAGKSHFSLQVFDMGFEGAISSIKKLLAACEIPFFKRWGKYC